MTDIINGLKGWLALYGLGVIGAVVILVVGVFAVKLVTRLATRVMRKAKVDETLVTFGGNVLNFLLMAFVIIAALNQVGFQTASLIAVLGAAGLAVGLALQGQLSSLAAGVLILITRPFKLGNLVEVAGGTLGTVESITILNTRLKIADGTSVTLPNTKVFGDKISNYHETPNRRIDLVIGIGYDDDIKKAKDLLMNIMESDERVLKEPAPTVVVLELADSSVNFAVRPWAANSNYWQTRCDLLEKIKLVFDEQGVSIPYPQQDVHLFTQDKPAQAA